MKKILFIVSTIIFCGLLPMGAYAQNISSIGTQVIVKAQVQNIQNQETQQVAGTQVSTINQTLRAQILEGTDSGKVITAENDYEPLSAGELFYLTVTKSADGSMVYTVLEPYRIPQLFVLIGIFVIIVLLFGGIQGLRGLVSLAGSLFVIFYFLLPGILHGVSPLWGSFGIALFIIILGSYITHGFNRTTSAAVLGMLATILLTGLFAIFAVHYTHLSGFPTEETSYLNMDTNGTINFIYLLLAGILIGLLGVLYDVAISQAISVEELLRVAPHISRKELFTRALRIGREHIGALVNLLAIAYVGVSLPLLLLALESTNGSLLQAMNKEIFATEIVRSIIASVGLVIAVPLTTFVAVWFLTKEHTQINTLSEKNEK